MILRQNFCYTFWSYHKLSFRARVTVMKTLNAAVACHVWQRGNLLKWILLSLNLSLRSMSEIISLSAVWDGTRLEGCGAWMMTAVNGGLKKDFMWFQFWCSIIPLTGTYRLYRRDFLPQCIGFRCTPDHMCTHSEGHCKSDSDCERSGYHICGATCIGWFF